MPTTKEFRTFDEQINILEGRKLKFRNKSKAKKYFRNITISMSLMDLNLYFLNQELHVKNMIMYILKIFMTYISLI